MLFIKRNRNRILASFFVLLVIVLFVVYAVYPRLMNGVWPEWTGFSKYTDPTEEYYRAKTLWDWLLLLIIPAILGFGVLWFNSRQREAERRLTEQRAKTERELAADRQREDALQNYLDKMSELLLEKNLLDKKDSEVDPILDVARVRTVTILRMLDKDRRNILLQFLRDANLAGFILKRANLRETDLSGAILFKVDLSGADLFKTNLSEAILIGADLSGALMIGADLSEAHMAGARLNGAILGEADLSGANVTREQLSEVGSLDRAIMPDGTVQNKDANSWLQRQNAWLRLPWYRRMFRDPPE